MHLHHRWILLSLLLPLFLYCHKDNPVELAVSSALENFAAAGGSSELTVSCNTGWSVTDTSSWCLTSATNTTGNGSFTMLVQPNPDTVERTTTVTVRAGSQRKEVMVVQAGKTPPDPNAGIVPDSIGPDRTGMRDLKSVALAPEMIPGWNLGNSLEAIGGETAWGNPLVSKRLIDSVKKAGFKAVRIPVAWSRFSDAPGFTIDTNWMRRVEEVVNYVLNDGLYAIINIHWDNGWMQPTYAQQVYVNNRLAIMWKQIAKRFRHYDDHLLFAGTNEVMKEGDYGTPTVEYYTVQNSFNQTFVNTVRATGGRNAYRHLVVQGFNTNIDHTVNFMQLPTDAVDHRLMVEVHYYDPYNFTLNENSNITQWGKDATDPSKTETWANEAWADEQFRKMKNSFIDQGYAVLLGEYAAMARLNLGTEALNAEHAMYRLYYIGYITQSAIDHGLIPFYWDAGATGDKGSGLFYRATGESAYPEIIRAITSSQRP